MDSSAIVERLDVFKNCSSCFLFGIEDTVFRERFSFQRGIATAASRLVSDIPIILNLDSRLDRAL